VSDLSPIIREIKQRRINLGLTQTAVAKAAGISKTAVCEIEKGGHKPNLDTLIGLARGLGLVLR
jgi:DNA-binding XRE family transcriptional regulator